MALAIVDGVDAQVIGFVVYLIGYLVISWMPTIFGSAGVAASTALIAVACLNIGGVVGGVLIGRASDRTGQPTLVLVVGFVVAGLATSFVASALSSDVALWAVCTVIGLGVGGAYGAGAAVAPATYPVRARSTGVGWAYGVGRVGSIVGPAIGGLVLGAGLAAGAIFSSLLIPIGRCAVPSRSLGPWAPADGAGGHSPGADGRPLGALSRPGGGSSYGTHEEGWWTPSCTRPARSPGPACGRPRS